MSLDQVPGGLSLYIGGLFTLRRKTALRDARITHVLSVLRLLPPDHHLFADYTHHVVPVDDTDDENLLEHFPACNRFIQDALDAGGAVFVHCAMGKSRSATVVCAYLMRRYGLSPTDALDRVRQARPFCEPNDGFMAQLRLFHEMAAPDDVDNAPAYQRWLYRREIELSRACGLAPDADKIRFEDEHISSAESDSELRCRKCRRTLATSQFLVNHQSREAGNTTTSSSCAHFFLDPLSWMRPELEQGKLDGRFECPKCRTNVGKYAWQGMQCSCGDWVVPGISLARGRIDEVKPRGAAAASGIRLPPGRKAGSGNL